MKVVTLDKEAFASACGELQQAVSAVFTPDLVIGIESGGAYVVEQMFPGIAHALVDCRRPSTSLKRRLFKRIAASLPLWLADRLRIVEANLLGRKKHKKREPATLTDHARQCIAKASKIIVVDDAVDSGSTLRRVLDAVHGAAQPTCLVMSAAITVTTLHPVARPDFSLYNNQTLIRFPWSADSHRQ